jgi:hypothetical protein
MVSLAENYNLVNSYYLFLTNYYHSYKIQMEEFIMDKKQELVDYLLTAKYHMERERGRKVTNNDFADVVDLPPMTVSAMFDPDNPRLPSKANATKVAIGLGSNQINRILGYPEIDPTDISFFRIYRQLNTDEREAILRKMVAFKESPKSEALAY